VIINSILHEKVEVGPKSVICHSNIHGKVTIHKDSFISGLVTDPEVKLGTMKFSYTGIYRILHELSFNIYLLI